MRRTDGADKVSGALAYTEDMTLPGLVHARLVLSYVTSGSIGAIRVEEALRVPGVVAVVTADDLGLEGDAPDLPPARRRVYQVSQRVAAVVAETPAAAADAAALVEVEYEEQPGAVGLDAALAADAPLVLPQATGDDGEASIHGAATGAGHDGPQPAGNV